MSDSALSPQLIRPLAMPTGVKVSLRQGVGQAFVIAYRESTHRLEAQLAQQGLTYQVLRQFDVPELEGAAAIYRCMVNHSQAWKQAAIAPTPSLIMEADFVPVVDMANLPIPFDVRQANVGLGWLYTCAPQIYSVSPHGFAEGFSTSLVAYVITPQGAAHLCSLVDWVTAQYGKGYSTFDSTIDRFLRDRGLQNYVAFRNYGEHGGIPNPEHRRHGFSGIHRADVLYGPLTFCPTYAGTGIWAPWRYGLARLHAKAKGLGRLVCGRFVRPHVLQTTRHPWLMIQFAIARQFTLRL
ncbi:LPS biosynthesis glycosyltransferase [Leptolyngbya sp. AN02str]|uniref:LPS biosynthesis glycosyltransferase n=1 Tax=Leptolyngbya sp. AN02str TaxID=3423363 RepID=UPI003D323BEC